MVYTLFSLWLGRFCSRLSSLSVPRHEPHDIIRTMQKARKTTTIQSNSMFLGYFVWWLGGFCRGVVVAALAGVHHTFVNRFIYALKTLIFSCVCACVRTAHTVKVVGSYGFFCICATSIHSYTHRFKKNLFDFFSLSFPQPRFITILSVCPQ